MHTSITKLEASVSPVICHICVKSQALDEIHAGIFDGMSYEQIEEQQPEEFRARKSDKLRYRCGAQPL